MHSSIISRSRTCKPLIFSVLILHLSAPQIGADSSSDALYANFQNPPDASRPRTWWHWTGGNVTLDGISKDLEWMKRVGIAGFQLADVAFGSGQTVENKLLFGTPEWLAALRHAAQEAERLQLEMAIFSSAGWSLTGGPWVQPHQAMKKLVCSDTLIHGPGSFSGTLPQPPRNNGPIGNLGQANRPGQPADPTFYRDVALLAYRLPAAPDMLSCSPRVTSHAGLLDASALLDDDLNSSLTIQAPPDSSPAWIQFEFAEPFAARAFAISGGGGIPVGRLTASDDGETFRTLVRLPGAQLYR
ncbi:hypothetical protein JW998_04585 [candidate division KSB1 bacterium]|nr:hypothetical protein [candidate division KSB1 bacterium]